MESPNENQEGPSGIGKPRTTIPLRVKQGELQEAAEPLTVDDLPEMPEPCGQFYPLKVRENREKLIEKWHWLDRELHSQGTGASAAGHLSPEEGWQIVKDCYDANHKFGSGRLKA